MRITFFPPGAHCPLRNELNSLRNLPWAHSSNVSGNHLLLTKLFFITRQAGWQRWPAWTQEGWLASSRAWGGRAALTEPWTHVLLPCSSLWILRFFSPWSYSLEISLFHFNGKISFYHSNPSQKSAYLLHANQESVQWRGPGLERQVHPFIHVCRLCLLCWCSGIAGLCAVGGRTISDKSRSPKQQGITSCQ